MPEVTPQNLRTLNPDQRRLFEDRIRDLDSGIHKQKTSGQGDGLRIIAQLQIKPRDREDLGLAPQEALTLDHYEEFKRAVAESANSILNNRQRALLRIFGAENKHGEGRDVFKRDATLLSRLERLRSGEAQVLVKPSIKTQPVEVAPRLESVSPTRRLVSGVKKFLDQASFGLTRRVSLENYIPPVRDFSVLEANFLSAYIGAVSKVSGLLVDIPKGLTSQLIPEKTFPQTRLTVAEYGTKLAALNGSRPKSSRIQPNFDTSKLASLVADLMGKVSGVKIRSKVGEFRAAAWEYYIAQNPRGTEGDFEKMIVSESWLREVLKSASPDKRWAEREVRQLKSNIEGASGHSRTLRATSAVIEKGKGQ